MSGDIGEREKELEDLQSLLNEASMMAERGEKSQVVCDNLLDALNHYYGGECRKPRFLDGIRLANKLKEPEQPKNWDAEFELLTSGDFTKELNLEENISAEWWISKYSAGRLTTTLEGEPVKDTIGLALYCGMAPLFYMKNFAGSNLYELKFPGEKTKPWIFDKRAEEIKEELIVNFPPLVRGEMFICIYSDQPILDMDVMFLNKNVSVSLQSIMNEDTKERAYVDLTGFLTNEVFYSMPPKYTVKE